MPEIYYLFSVDGATSYYRDKFETLDPGVPLQLKANTLWVDASTDSLLITNANTYTKIGDRVLYQVSANTHTAIAGLTSNNYYYVLTANTSAISLSTSEGGSVVNLTESRTSNPAETHYLYLRDYEPLPISFDRGIY